ncbi:Nn.00g116050.m01.CDS01 [Neocucurbitaria sp. VM-36]
MYYAHKMENKVWNSFSLACMTSRYSRLPKLDTDTVQIDTSKENDLANTITSTIWDSIANNAGKIVYCLEQSEAMSMDKWVGLSTKTGSDTDYFEGGYVLEPRPGCYKGAIVIDGNSLYGSIMMELDIFVDRCISAHTLEGLLEKAGVHSSYRVCS